MVAQILKDLPSHLQLLLTREASQVVSEADARGMKSQRQRGRHLCLARLDWGREVNNSRRGGLLRLLGLAFLLGTRPPCCVNAHPHLGTVNVAPRSAR